MLIGLNGKARSGKDSVYGYIEEWAQGQGIPIRHEAFADRLKLSLARLFEPHIDQAGALAWAETVKLGGMFTLSIQDQDAHSIDGRTLIERFGDESHRQVLGEEVWIDPVLGDYRCFDELLVVTDVRYANEARAVRAQGGRIWRVLRPHSCTSTHISNQGIPDAYIHSTIHNDEDLYTLRRRVRSTLDHTVILAGL